MAAIVALHGKVASVSINAVTFRITSGSFNIDNDVVQFFTTGETADADSQYWMNKISGVNNWSFEGSGYLDRNAVAANRAWGDNIKIRPGTGASGTLSVAIGTTFGFSGTVVVKSLVPSFDAESNKPSGFRFVLEGDGALTYVNS